LRAQVFVLAQRFIRIMQESIVNGIIYLVGLVVVVVAVAGFLGFH
jgi:hypothetical protein